MTNRLAAVVLAAITPLAAPTTWAQSDQPLMISIEESQPLSDALQSFADQADLQVIFFADIAEGKTTSGIDGEYVVDAALDTLLADTGLSYIFIDDTAVSVQVTATSERGASDSKNSSPAPVFMAQSQTSQAQTISNSRSDEGGTSIVTGKVTDARTGANLKGAKVAIEDTGQWTSTNDLGEFRLVNVPTGTKTVTVSYLGYAGQSALVGVRGDGTSQDFALRGGSEIEEIVVFGQRSARAIALNQERTAENFRTVLSADFLGNFDGTTISESLRRAPGISFTEDPVTGEGTNVIVRGLAPDLNSVTLNGVRLPEGSGEGRAADLSGILTESISEIVVSKTLLADQDSAGTGGLIEIETKGPLDRPRRFFNVGVEGLQADGSFRDQVLGTVTISGIFGTSSDFGLSASVQFRDSDIENIFYTLDGFDLGPYLPLAEDGTPVSGPGQIDTSLSYPFEDGAAGLYPNRIVNIYQNAKLRNTSYSVSAQKLVGDHTELRMDYARNERDLETFRRLFSLQAFYAYELMPIAELNDEPRYALIWDDAFAGIGFPGANVQPGHNYQIVETKEVSDILSLRGTTTIGRWEHEYVVGYTSGERKQPRIASLSGQSGFLTLNSEDLLPELGDTRNGSLIAAYQNRAGNSEYPFALLTPTGYARLNDPANYAVNGTSKVQETGKNENITARLDSKLHLGRDAVGYVQGGLFYEDLRFESTSFPGSFSASNQGPLTFEDLSLTFAGDNLARIGLPGGFNMISRSSLESFFAGLEQNPAFDLGDRDFDERNLDTFTEERSYGAYLMAQLEVGRLELIAGLRSDNVDITARNLSNSSFRDSMGVFDPLFAERTRVVVDQEASQSRILPRALVNFRFTDKTILRGGYYESIARPQIGQLSTTQTVSVDLKPIFGPNDDQPLLQVFSGNPDLKPAITKNYDISLEIYDDNAGVFKLSLFYKDIENLTEQINSNDVQNLDGIVLPDDPLLTNLPSNMFVRVIKPFNNDRSARIWGAEFNLEKQLTSLPGFWSGFGFGINGTYTESDKKVFDSFFDPVLGEFVDITFNRSFNQQPKYSGTASLFYNLENIDATLAYTRQDRRLRRSPESFGLDQYFGESDSLDLRVEYRVSDAFGGDWRFYIEGSDLLKSSDYPEVELVYGGARGVPEYFAGGTFLGGRTIAAGVFSTFQ